MLGSKYLFITLLASQGASAFKVNVPSEISLSAPVTVSWHREEHDGSPHNWFFQKQNMAAASGRNDFTSGVSEMIKVPDADDDGGKVAMTFTFAAGNFRLMGFKSGETNPFYQSPTLHVLEAAPPAVSATSSSSSGSPTSSSAPNDPTVLSTSSSSSSYTFPTDDKSQKNTIATGSPTQISITKFDPQPDSPATGSVESSSFSPGSNSPSTTNQQVSGNPNHSNIPVILGAVLGSLIFLVLSGLILWAWWRRRQRKSFRRELMIRDLNQPDPRNPQLFGLKTEKRQRSVSSFHSSSSLYTSKYSLSEDDYEASATEYYSPQESIPKYGYQTQAPTDRQMYIQDKIMELRQQMIGSSEPKALQQIEKWKVLQSSDWALHLTNDPPVGL
ncbi:hypothetical protein VKT23_012926 [Stygiomarasmius scandens]|uniref:Mid2 domain-containing protein n=1 Tax=Marasmiellus scandens TaxID=2682957 RepID=A0ABR1J586_9AGAR